MRSVLGWRGALPLLLACCVTTTTRTAAQIPELAELGSTWQTVRVCRPSAPTQPCPAGSNLDKKTCHDYGCCFSGKTCFAPNGQQRLGGGEQDVFAAAQAVPALAQPGAALSVDSNADLLGIQCFDAPPFAGQCGPLTFGHLSLDGVPSNRLATGMQSRWRPHEIVRNATLWRTGSTARIRGSSSVRMGFDSQTVMLRLELEALTHSQAPLNISVSLAAVVFAQTSEWEWPIARPTGAGMDTSIRQRGNGALTTHVQSNTSSASAFSTRSPAPTLTLANATSAVPIVVASWTGVQMKVGEPLVVELALVVGHKTSSVQQAVDTVVDEFSSAWDAAETDWGDWWRSAFDPGIRAHSGRPDFDPALKFEGQLPILTTDDVALRRTYYMGVVTLLTMARHDTVPGSRWEGTMAFGSAGVESAVTAMYIWDTTLNSLLLTLLAPAFFQSVIAAWLSMGIHNHYAVDFVSNRGIGPWYAFNDMMIFRAMDTMARFGDARGPENYAQSIMMKNKTNLQWMDETATYWQALLHGVPKNIRQQTTSSVNGSSTVDRGDLSSKCEWSGVWWGCHGDTPTKSGCDFTGPIDMTAVTANGNGNVNDVITLQARWPEGVKRNFWASATGNASTATGGEVALDLFSANGEPYPALHVLRGTVEECGVFKWTEQHTVWCKNGSSPTCSQSPPPPVDGLADYGNANNLLECVPSYVHKVPSLNAANAWMMRRTALLSSANGSRASELRIAADRLSKLVQTKLYVKGDSTGTLGKGGYWACEQPDGKLVPVRHVIDFITIGAALVDDLSNETKEEMVAFVKRELLTKNWMRALSMQDAAAPASDRKDHGPFGAYDGWLGETVEVLSLFGRHLDALNLVRNMAPVYDRGPGGQSHQVFDRGGTVFELPAKAHADQQYIALSGAVISNRVITGLFGVDPPLQATETNGPQDFLREPSTSRGFKGNLTGLLIQGKRYTVTSGDSGLSIRVE